MHKKAFRTLPDLEKACVSTLHKNWRSKCTIPTAGLYPFQWLWDSAFSAVGWAYIDLSRARQEFQTILDCQWENGFLAHIVYHDDDAGKSYFPGSAFQGAGANPYAPKHVATSGITQPPNLGYCLEQVFQLDHARAEHTDFYKNTISGIFRFHAYLYRDRDPQQEYLPYIRHNWESGTDNAVQWDAIWQSFEPRQYDIQRRDTEHVNDQQRPTKKDYNYYLTLIELSKELNFDEQQMQKTLPFLVQDPLFNALLVASNESLARLALQFGMSDIANTCLQWAQKTKKAMNRKLFDPIAGMYNYYDLRNEKMIKGSGAPSMVALTAGIPNKRQAHLMKKTLQSAHYWGEDKAYFLCATNAVTATDYDSKRYWRGPVWIPTNWLIWKGCERYGFKSLAKQIKKDSLALVQHYGLFEYFEPAKSTLQDPDSTGYGGADFSWSAALILDMIQSDNANNTKSRLDLSQQI
ncbi:MAG: trehalase family glycosidase [Saprospiraceae bacterium]|nr:trehalase family glycosidase [Saprospiraceae bacterium]